MRIAKRYLLAPFFESVRHLPRFQQFRLLWKKGWDEIPLPMVGGMFGIVGAIGIIGEIIYYTKHGQRSKYIHEPIFYRPDDPRIKDIIHDSPLDKL